MTDNAVDFIGYAMTDIARLLRTVFERRVRDLGITRAQWVVIARLHARPGLSQSEVADILEIEKASAGRLIDRMEAKGWLQRRADPADRRINRLHLTAEAERLHDLIWPVAEATVDDALLDLSERERAAFDVLAGKVRARLLSIASNDERGAPDWDNLAKRADHERRARGPRPVGQQRAAIST
ncbi:MAG: MarR family winged helix-turn-helix transcriptional regulator [Hyphomicrobiaceae bacterium]